MNFAGYPGHLTFDYIYKNAYYCLKFSIKIGVRVVVRVRVRIRFSVWLVSTYAHVFILLFVVIVTLPKITT